MKKSKRFMSKYIHKVNYYETDKMGITHHSNYIRFMEEARMNFLSAIGYPMTRLEEEGITSPVVSVNCEYKHTTTYSDEIEIEVALEKYTGVKLFLSYAMRNANTGETVAIASSTHCFMDKDGRPIAVKKRAPELDAVLRGISQKDIADTPQRSILHFLPIGSAFVVFIRRYLHISPKNTKNRRVLLLCLFFAQRFP